MMRGKVLGFDIRGGEGRIAGDDGARYRFGAGEWKPGGYPRPGQSVDFEAEGGEALAIYPLGAGFGARDKSRIAAALLALFLGAFGIHKFYLGKNGAGITMLLISIFGFILAGIPTTVIAIIAFIEFVIYLFRSDEAFDALYVKGDKAWF